MSDQNRRSTAWSDCEAIDRAVELSCCRVCSARRLAASSLVSASVRLAAPVSSVLIIFLVKSVRFCTIDRLEPKADDCERSVPRASDRVDSLASIVASLSKAAAPRGAAAGAPGDLAASNRVRGAFHCERLDELVQEDGDAVLQLFLAHAKWRALGDLRPASCDQFGPIRDEELVHHPTTIRLPDQGGWTACRES